MFTLIERTGGCFWPASSRGVCCSGPVSLHLSWCLALVQELPSPSSLSLPITTLSFPPFFSFTLSTKCSHLFSSLTEKYCLFRGSLRTRVDVTLHVYIEPLMSYRPGPVVIRLESKVKRHFDFFFFSNCL